MIRSLLGGILMVISHHLMAQSVLTTDVSRYKMDLEKVIGTDLNAHGTFSCQKIGDNLIMHDAHVSARVLKCISYSTGKKKWELDYEASNYFYHNGLLIVQGFEVLSAHEMETGKLIWQIDDCMLLNEDMEDGGELGNEIGVVYKEEDAILDLNTKKTKAVGQIVPAILFQLNENGSATKFYIDIKDRYHHGENFIAAAVVESKNNFTKTYVWSLDPGTRIHTVEIYDEHNKKLQKHTWNIENNIYGNKDDRYYMGLPEPESLWGLVYLIGEQLIIMENYVDYRWSWGIGCNRISTFNIVTDQMNYQTWGASPQDSLFHTFNFLNEMVLLSDGVMNYQNPATTCQQFDLRAGKSTNLMEKQFTVLKDLIPGVVLGFEYNDEGPNLSVMAWNSQANAYSKSFDLSFEDIFPSDPYVLPDGYVLIPCHEYGSEHTYLYCYKLSMK